MSHNISFTTLPCRGLLGNLKKFGMIKDMSMRIGHFDPLQLTFNIMNALMKKGVITYEEAREIIKASLPVEMPTAEKEAVLDSMVVKTKK